MNLFFRKEMTLRSNLGLLEICSWLTKLISNEDSNKIFEKKYAGIVSGGSFHLYKIYWKGSDYFRKSVIFTGVIKPEASGTLLEIKIRKDKTHFELIPPLAVIIIIWLSDSTVDFEPLGLKQRRRNLCDDLKSLHL